MSNYRSSVQSLRPGFRCTYGKCDSEAVEQFNGRWVCHGHTIYLAEKKVGDISALESARQWLIENGITKPGMSRSDELKAMAKFRKEVAGNLGNFSLDWAYLLKSRHLDGEWLSVVQINAYRAALGDGGIQTLEAA